MTGDFPIRVFVEIPDNTEHRATTSVWCSIIMEAKIIQVLRENATPMTAPAIAKKIGCTKKEVNQVVYKMKEVEIANPGEKPAWRLVAVASASESTADSARQRSPGVAGAEATASSSDQGSPRATPSVSSMKMNDSELEKEIPSVLSSNQTLSAPDIARKLHQPTDAVKRVLYNLEIKGIVQNLSPRRSKPLWSLRSSSDNRQPAQFEEQPLFTKREVDGKLIFTPVTEDDIAKASAVSAGSEHPPPPPLPTLTPDGTSNTTSQDTATISSPSPVPTLSSRGVNLATNFSRLAAKFELSQQEKEKVKELLQNNPGSHTCEEVKEGIGAETRDLVMAYLDDLVEEGRVKKHETDNLSIYEWKR